MASVADIRTFIYDTPYDSWNGVRNMTYHYNAAGQIVRLSGNKQGRESVIVDRIGYDKDGHTVYTKLGNGTETTYTYDKQRERLQAMNLTVDGRAVMENRYQYDAVDNILGIANAVDPTQAASNNNNSNNNGNSGKAKLGGAFNHTYAYDDLNRLIRANGEAKGAKYEMTMTFGRMSEPLTKVQKVDSTKTAQSYDFTYKYEDSNHPTAPTQIGHEHYTYDTNGNPTLVENDSLNTERRMYWDEDNRLMVLSDNGKTSRYTYNAAGERIVKSHGDLEGVYINGAPQGLTFHETEDYTIYPTPIITVTKNRFTKHYFIGDKRVASKLGVGKFSNVYGISGNNVTAGQKDYAARIMQIEKQREEYYRKQGTPPGVPTMKGATADPDNTGYGYNTIIGELGDHSVPESWVQRPKFNDKGDVPGPPIQWQKPEDPDNAQPGYGYVPTDTTNTEEIFFYHSDHLGSTSYITDAKANITQFDAYLPYGELLVDEHSSSEEMPYKFNGKEFDQETGLYYYGARYMNPRTSLWYGVDPLAEKYPNINPYAYAFFNPIKFIDPNGESSEEGGWIGTTKSNKKTSWEWDSEVDTESQARAKYGNVEFYKGGNKVFHESGTNKPFHLKDNGTWEYFSERNSANVSLPIILGESIVSDIALSTLLKFTGTWGMVLSLQGDSPESNYKYFYRAMSASEYAKTNGYLMDTRTTGEGPHVRRDIQYLLDAKFINNSGKYDYIVQYMVKKEAAELFDSTPFVFTPGQGKGGEIFNSARKVGLPYMKYEKGDFSYGFPGSKATTLFNSSLIGKPKIIHKIGTK